jgi:ComF family protein
MLKESLRRTFAGLAEIAFPARCVQCGREGSLACDACLATATRLTGPACLRCALPLAAGRTCQSCFASPPAVDRMIAAYAFDGVVREAVHAFKYDDTRSLAPLLGDLLAGASGAARLVHDIVVPVPLHPSRLRSRGYNQSELLAREVARRLGSPCRPDLLRRTMNTPPQARSVDERERAARVAKAFLASPAVRGQRILLVDDVATTGSTLNACAASLKRSGAEWVGSLVLAREL